jgi:hypothetical protein
MRWLVGVVCSIVMLGSACGDSGSSSPLDDQPYRNTEVGFALSFPSDWPTAYLQSDNDTNVLVQVSRGDFVGEPTGVLRGMSLRVRKLTAEQATGPVRGRLNHLDGEFAEVAGDLGGALSQRDQADVGGLQARRFVIDYTNEDDHITLEYLVAQTNDYEYQFSCEAPSDEWDMISDLCRQSLATFKLEGRAATAQVPTTTPTEPTHIGTPTPVVATVAAGTLTQRCGSDISLIVTGESPIGRSYHDGDQLSVRLRYHTPGSKELGAIFDGIHTDGSPWYEYWCITPGTLLTACTEDRINSMLIDSGTDAIPLSGDDGEVTITTKGGTFPPTELDSEPPLEGFTLCRVSITLDDGVDEGGGPDARLQLGDGCP